MKRGVLITILVAILAFTLGLFVPLNANNRDKKPEAERYSLRRTSPEDTMELLEIIKTWKASKELKLAPEQVNIFITKLNMVEDTKRAHYEARKAIIDEIKKMIAQSNPDTITEENSKLIDDLLAKLNRVDTEFEQKLEDQLKDLESDLSPWQRGRLITFLEDYRRDMRRIMSHMMNLASMRK